MNELWRSMSKYLHISPYSGETDNEYICRICFSALGLWCLKLAQKSAAMPDGRSKNGLTVSLDNLLKRYKQIAPSIEGYFDDDTEQQTISALIREVYEETGYFLTKGNKDCLANHGRTIAMGKWNLFFGLPVDYAGSCGLGAYAKKPLNVSSIEELLIRDDLDASEYYGLNFKRRDFEERDIDVDELEFFNPLINRAPSRCWERRCAVGTTIARKSEYGPYYKIIRDKGGRFFFRDESSGADDSLTSREYRRLSFAIRAHYKNQLPMYVYALNDEYSEIRFQGALPNREYYFLLLTAWPKGHAFNKTQFIIRTEMLEKIHGMFEKLGIKITRGTRRHVQ